MLGTRIYVLSHLYIITSGFDLSVKMNLNYICSTSFTLNSSTKFRGSLLFFGGEICGETGKGTDRTSPQYINFMLFIQTTHNKW